MSQFVDVAVPVGVRKTFTYSVPEELRNAVALGCRVLVPFGKKLLTGFVVGLKNSPPAREFRIHPIRNLIDSTPPIPESLVHVTAAVADYYFTPPGELLRATMPAGSQPLGEQVVRLSERAARLLSGGLRPTQLHAQEIRLLDLLASKKERTVAELAHEDAFREPRSWVESLQKKGWVEVTERLAKPRVSTKQRRGIRALAVPEGLRHSLSEKQRTLYDFLSQKSQPWLLQAALQVTQTSGAAARALEKKGCVEILPLSIDRLPLELSESGESIAHTLTEAQQEAYDRIREALRKGVPCRFLLHGVTGSGKTEIYLRLIGEALKLCYSSILMVPEIGLTPLLSRIALSHFPDRVAILHSGMSAGERWDQWNRIRSGRAPVVVGTRSAAFAPLENLRLVLIDEEQDGSYKQDEAPFYHARDVAWERVRLNGGILVLGSATPSLETYHAARASGEIGYLRLPERIQARPLPDVTIVDMSLEFQRHGKKTIVSELLELELQSRLGRGEQSIVLLNRRGYSRMLLCRSCGHTVTCSDCSISMTYHQKVDRLLCHYCGMERRPPSCCEQCQGEYIYFVGVGTEQLEEIVRKSFPSARIARIDRDTTSRRGALRRYLLDFYEGRIDILVGTQILAKGHDFPNVTLVGVIGADAGLSFPDFRSAERTFQLLTQVAGRAGRGSTPGKVVIQSFYPNHYALRYAGRQDFEGFYEHEIEFRRLLGYPPFNRLIQIVISDAGATKAQRLAEKAALVLSNAAKKGGAGSSLRILGPAAAPIEKLRGKFRYQLLLKFPRAYNPIPLLRESFEELGARRAAIKNIRVDIDPLSLL